MIPLLGPSSGIAGERAAELQGNCSGIASEPWATGIGRASGDSGGDGAGGRTAAGCRRRAPLRPRCEIEQARAGGLLLSPGSSTQPTRRRAAICSMMNSSSAPVIFRLLYRGGLTGRRNSWSSSGTGGGLPEESAEPLATAGNGRGSATAGNASFSIWPAGEVHPSKAAIDGPKPQHPRLRRLQLCPC